LLLRLFIGKLFQPIILHVLTIPTRRVCLVGTVG